MSWDGWYLGKIGLAWLESAKIWLLSPSFRMIWLLRAPGHGKGVCDSIGAAWMKRTVGQDITDHRDEMLFVLTKNVDILSPAEVAERLQSRCPTQCYVESHIMKQDEQ